MKFGLSDTVIKELQDVWKTFVFDILGLRLNDNSDTGSTTAEAYKGAVDLLLNIRLDAKRNKDWTTSDRIRNSLTELGFSIKDTKDGFEWSI